jgi:hypothetical protein
MWDFIGHKDRKDRKEINAVEISVIFAFFVAILLYSIRLTRGRRRLFAVSGRFGPIRFSSGM